MNKRPIIKINNKHEKMAALLYLSKISGRKLGPICFSDTRVGEDVNKYSYVFVDEYDSVISRQTPHSNDVIVSLDELYKHDTYESLVKFVNKIELKVGSKVKLNLIDCVYTVILDYSNGKYRLMTDGFKVINDFTSPSLQELEKQIAAYPGEVIS